MDTFKRQDYNKSILLQYELDPVQVSLATENLGLFQFMDDVFSQIVEPMEIRLKKLVIKINICSESEIFASSLEHKVFLL